MSQYLGDISAYALAVSQGYTGTEEEYAELMASYATVGQTAVNAAQTATTKASEAATSATTATNKASEATTAATTATNKAAEAQADADAAALDASQAMSAASTATSKATEATTAAATATSAKTDAVAANTAAQSAKTAAQTAQTGAETAAASVQSSAAQIATNTSDITELKEDTTQLKNTLSDITNKSVKPIAPTEINAIYNNGTLNFVSEGKSIYFPISSWNKYTIHITGAFNRFIVAVCNEIRDGVTATMLQSDGAGSFTDKSYEYVADGTYSYMLITLAYSYSSYATEQNVVEYVNYSDNEFIVNGIQTVEMEEIPDILAQVTADQYIRNASYIESTALINNAAITTVLSGKSIFIPLDVGVTYDVTISGFFNRFQVALCNALASGTPVTILRSDGIVSAQTRSEKSYSYKADGTYSYMMVVYNYDHDSTATDINLAVTAEKIIPDSFVVNGIPVYTKAEVKQIFTSAKYLRANDDISLISTSSGVFALYDALVSAYPQYVSKNTLTHGTFTNYEYVFGTADYNDVSGQRNKDSVISKPTILLTSGVHGYERSAVMSTYAFFKAMCENAYPVSEVLQKICIRLIPIVCPWGYDNNKRWNANGVNINRNFDANWSLDGEPFANDYSGPSAASEDETQLVQDWIDSHIAAAVAYIDHHNSGFNNEVSYLGALNTLANADKLKSAYREGVDDATGYWTKDRDMDSALIFGYTGQMCINGSAPMYGALKNKLSATLETSWNQNASGQHSAFTIGVGAEALSLLLIGMCDKII